MGTTVYITGVLYTVVPVVPAKVTSCLSATAPATTTAHSVQTPFPAFPRLLVQPLNPKK
jgi:hypothetical protein